MYCTEVLVTLLGLFGATLSFGARGIVPFAPRRYAHDYCAQRRASTKPWYTALTRGIRGSWASGGKIFSLPEFCATLRKRIVKFCRTMVLLKELAQTYREVFP